LLHIQGKKLSEIAEETGRSTSYISTTIRSTAAKNIIQDFYSFQDAEFEALYQLSVDAVRDALRDDDKDVRLKAAKMFLQAHGKLNRKDYGQATAEDVVRRIMEIRLVEETPVR
jgi:DNA-binding transcriptional regulator GbsR (MarR family)